MKKNLSLYGQYIKEREGYDILEDERAFFSYKQMNQDLYIRDIFVTSNERFRGAATEFAEKVTEIAKGLGCTHLMGTVYPGTNGATESMTVLLQYGFQIFSAKDGVIVLKKEIS